MDATQQKYPVKEIFKAINALRLNFDITEIDHLYVDFDSVRSNSSIGNLLFNLGILDNCINEDAGNAKILYTGHTGSGKSTELLKLHHRLHNPELYFSIYLDVEDYMQISDFKSEDLIVLFIAALVNALEEQKINYSVPGLQKIADDWLSEKEVSEEIKNKAGNEAGISGEIGTGGLLKFFSAKAFIRSAFSYDSQTSQLVRRKIMEKQGDYIISLNLALEEIRKEIRRTAKGKEIVFILDGLEKHRWGRYDMYTQTFNQNTKLVKDIKCSLISCVPIDTMYDPMTSRVLSTYDHQFILPLIPINQETLPLFSQIITRRIDKDTFFEEGALEYCVEQSGGSPRQLLRISELALSDSRANNFKITVASAQKTCKLLGLDLKRRLTSTHFRKLKDGDYEDADPLVLDLLYSLSLMEYNGNQNNRQVNPLLKPLL